MGRTDADALSYPGVWVFVAGSARWLPTSHSVAGSSPRARSLRFLSLAALGARGSVPGFLAVTSAGGRVSERRERCDVRGV
jgi:hypothetical protein